MWSQTLNVLNPYEALAKNDKGESGKEHNTRYIKFTSGKNIYDFFVIPTIRINSDCDITFVTVEWLWWFIGIKFDK